MLSFTCMYVYAKGHLTCMACGEMMKVGHRRNEICKSVLDRPQDTTMAIIKLSLKSVEQENGVNSDRPRSSK